MLSEFDLVVSGGSVDRRVGVLFFNFLFPIHAIHGRVLAVENAALIKTNRKDPNSKKRKKRNFHLVAELPMPLSLNRIARVQHLRIHIISLSLYVCNLECIGKRVC